MEEKERNSEERKSSLFFDSLSIKIGITMGKHLKVFGFLLIIYIILRIHFSFAPTNEILEI